MSGRIEKKKFERGANAGICYNTIGMMVTVAGDEKYAVKEVYNLIDQFIEIERTAGRIEPQLYVPRAKEETAKSVDAADDLSACVSEVKQQTSQRYVKPRQMLTKVKNIIFFSLPCSADELYPLAEKFIKRCQEMDCCRAVARCIPVENTSGPDPESIDRCLGKVIEKHFAETKYEKPPSYALEFKVRNNQTNKVQVLEMLGRHMQNMAPLSKVNLNTPDLTICVNVLNKIVLYSCIKNFHVLRKYSARPKGSTDDEKTDTEDEAKKAENERFKDVDSFLKERRKDMQEKREKLNKSKILSFTRPPPSPSRWKPNPNVAEFVPFSPSPKVTSGKPIHEARKNRKKRSISPVAENTLEGIVDDVLEELLEITTIYVDGNDPSLDGEDNKKKKLRREPKPRNFHVKKDDCSLDLSNTSTTVSPKETSSSCKTIPTTPSSIGDSIPPSKETSPSEEVPVKKWIRGQFVTTKSRPRIADQPMPSQEPPKESEAVPSAPKLEAVTKHGRLSCHLVGPKVKHPGIRPLPPLTRLNPKKDRQR